MAPTSPDNDSVRLMSMKLLVDTRCERVLYAEAGKDVVDFLFSLLALPVGMAAKLLGRESMVGSVGNLHSSVEKLDSTYLLPGAARDALIRPTVLSPAVGTNGSLFSLPGPSSEPARPMKNMKKYFRCSSHVVHNPFGSGLSPFGSGPSSACCHGSSPCVNYVTDTYGITCPSCSNKMDKEVEFLSSRRSEQFDEANSTNGIVQGVVTYMVMDDLMISPMSTISGITLLNSFGITDIRMLQETTVQLGYAEGLEILKASLQSKTVLTDVFLVKKKSPKD